MGDVQFLVELSNVELANADKEGMPMEKLLKTSTRSELEQLLLLHNMETEQLVETGHNIRSTYRDVLRRAASSSHHDGQLESLESQAQQILEVFRTRGHDLPILEVLARRARSRGANF